jgi:hypothetical protein
MISSRSVSLKPGQAAISSLVRPHPMHKLERGSSTQIFTQGVEGAGMALS